MENEQTNLPSPEPELATPPVESQPPAPSAFSSHPARFIVTFLLVTVLALTGMNMYQEHVIQKQRFELRWLLAHSVIRPETIAADLQREKQQQSGKPEVAQTDPAASSSTPSTAASATAKP